MDKIGFEAFEDKSFYCNGCGSCGETSCCSPIKFINGHGKDCKYYEIYKADMIKTEERLKETMSVLYEWIDKRGQDKCHYYPELFNKLLKIFEMTGEVSSLPPRSEFEEGCKRYQEELYGS